MSAQWCLSLYQGQAYVSTYNADIKFDINKEWCFPSLDWVTGVIGSCPKPGPALHEICQPDPISLYASRTVWGFNSTGQSSGLERMFVCRSFVGVSLLSLFSSPLPPSVSHRSVGKAVEGRRAFTYCGRNMAAAAAAAGAAAGDDDDF